MDVAHREQYDLAQIVHDIRWTSCTTSIVPLVKDVPLGRHPLYLLDDIHCTSWTTSIVPLGRHPLYLSGDIHCTSRTYVGSHHREKVIIALSNESPQIVMSAWLIGSSSIWLRTMLNKDSFNHILCRCVHSDDCRGYFSTPQLIYRWSHGALLD